MKVKINKVDGIEVIPIAKSTLTIGSAEHCDVVLSHESVEAEHVRAWLEGGRIWIQDLGTGHGTLLNGSQLPALKPMLVRELDLVKLGACTATIALEGSLVRAPVVKLVAPIEETPRLDSSLKSNSDSDMAKRREELAEVSRDLAELRLQLQMGRLEKTSDEEFRKQLHALREEIRQFTDQREKLQKSVDALDSERTNRLRLIDEEIEKKLKASESELQEMRDNAGRKMGHWKVDMVAELSTRVRALLEAKSKVWISRPMSQDMVSELNSELNVVFRQILLQEAYVQTPVLPVDAYNEDAYTEDEEPTQIVKLGENQATKKLRLPSAPKLAAKMVANIKVGKSLTHKQKFGTLAAGALMSLLAVFFLVKSLGHSNSVSRAVASDSAVSLAKPSGANVAAVKEAPSRTLKVPAPPERNSPRQAPEFKSSYTDNILFTPGFTNAEYNQTFHENWIQDLTKTMRDDWHGDVRLVGRLSARELQLIQDLQKLKGNVAAMRAREAQFQKELETVLGSAALVESYHRLKQAYYARNLRYLASQR